MLIVCCGWCGARLAEGQRDCTECGGGERTTSHLADVVRTAVELGGGRVTSASLLAASRALREEPS